MIRPIGWRYDSARHALAAQGVKTGRRYNVAFNPISLAGKFTRAGKVISEVGGRVPYVPLHATGRLPPIPLSLQKISLPQGYEWRFGKYVWNKNVVAGWRMYDPNLNRWGKAVYNANGVNILPIGRPPALRPRISGGPELDMEGL